MAAPEHPHEGLPSENVTICAPLVNPLGWILSQGHDIILRRDYPVSRTRDSASNNGT
jgi:hypothetical protein